MSDQYLWDQTGKPDAEVERFEKLLGQLRHQPRPLALPAAPRQYTWKRTAGIAAAAAVALLVSGLWLTRHSQRPSREPLTAEHRPAEAREIKPASEPPIESVKAAHRLRPARRANRPRQVKPLDLRPPGEAAKEQLLLALHIASHKLNLAQRKIQETAQPKS